jgi:CheY-like chemotaxis protein
MDVNESIRLILELSGHEVEVAYTGQDGVEVAKTFRPEVVLCDIGLPGDLNGYDVARALRDDPTTSSAHRIALTGYGQDNDQRRAFEAGFEKHLTKPFEPGDIQVLLESLPPRV